MADIVPIPGPKGLPVIGNVTDIDVNDQIGSLIRLADIYGEIFKLNLGGRDRVFITNNRLLHELCDEKRFQKAVAGPLEQIRHAVHDGLFTAYPGEHNWQVAHRTLMPAFGPVSIRHMFDEMHDIATQLVVKWARFGSEEKIDVTSDFTRLTLDSIAICAMGTRFNSFYREDMHPFVNSMVGTLVEAGNRARRPGFASYFMRGAQQKFDEDIDNMKKVATEVLAERRKHPVDKKDLLNAMILGRDPVTGEGLTDESILNNMITFLIAGHETTSGLLSFLFYYLIKNPEAYQAAQKEVDEVIGRGPITVDHMSKLPYLTACLRETLRLCPTAPAFMVQAKKDLTEDPVIIGGKYAIPKDQPVVCVLPKIHRDPAVYGSDSEEFKPERMLDENFQKLPPDAWHPFGNGVRACIGRPFAWQEALLATAILLQNFNFRFDDPSYTLAIKQTLTIKPKDFYMHASLREHIDVVHLERMLHKGSEKEGSLSETDKRIAAATITGKKKPMAIFYGSNAGTCEALAQTLARVSGSKGFDAKVNTLDASVDKIPKDQPVVFITSSYEGQPPDNAAHFVAWLTGLNDEKALAGVQYAVYGCGNHDWVSTFHRIPKLVDTTLASHGATRLVDAGLGDVAAGDIFNDFDKWQDDVFWHKVSTEHADGEEESSLQLEINTSSRPTHLRQNVKEAEILSNEVLTAPGGPEKRHIVLRLPTDMTYRVGDYLAVLPLNSIPTVRRVIKRFGLPWDAALTIKPGSNTTLPTGYPIAVMNILAAYVELSQPATKRNIQKIAASIEDDSQREEVLKLAGPDFTTIANQRISPLDILEKYPTAALPLASFLEMLPPMRIRQYSISSSPLADPTTASITWSVLHSAPTSEEGGKPFLGVASNYLRRIEPGERIHVAVKPSHGTFHLPPSIGDTPIVMLCAGTGLAPFIGFVQERAAQKAAGRSLAPAYLFIGCGYPDKDRLFTAELKKWISDGVVTVFYAFSKVPGAEEASGCKYVQDRLWRERAEMKRIFNEGARVYICGSAGVGEGVKEAVKRIWVEAATEKRKEDGRVVGSEEELEQQAEAWFQGMRGERYAADVFD